MKQLSSFHRSGVSLAACLLASAFWAGCGAPAAQKDAASQHSHANHSTRAAAPEANPTPRIPAFFANPEEAKPLRKVLDPKQFSTPAVAKAYQYATENPEIFAQQPCYCYCDASYEHKSLLDCFATDHGVGCALCLKEGLLVHKLHKEGKSVTEIRDLIIRGEWQNVKLD